MMRPQLYVAYSWATSGLFAASGFGSITVNNQSMPRTYADMRALKKMARDANHANEAVDIVILNCISLEGEDTSS